MGIHAVHAEYVLGQVNSYGSNIHDGLSSSLRLIGTTPFNLAHVMPSGAGESISFVGRYRRAIEKALNNERPFSECRRVYLLWRLQAAAHSGTCSTERARRQ
jgi:hypothetical protein